MSRSSRENIVTAQKMSRQHGVALISVLLIFVLVTIIASEIITRNFLDIRKTGNLINSQQAYHYTLSGEQFARQILYRDHLESKQQYGENRADTLLDSWAVIDQGFDLEYGEMTIDIIDLQSLFNINSLLLDDGSIDSGAASQFSRLQDNLDLRDDYTALLSDWLDSDDQALINGGEDALYQDDGYVTANSALVDKTELRLLKDMMVADYQLLSPRITVIATSDEELKQASRKFNINTLDAEVLKALLVNTEEEDIDQIITMQAQGGYNSIEAWLSSGVRADLNTISADIQTYSEFFEVHIKVIFDQRISVLKTQLYRSFETGKITILSRQQSVDD